MNSFLFNSGNAQQPSTANNDIVVLRKEPPNNNRVQFDNQVDGKAKTLNWLQERYSYDGQTNRNQEVYNHLAENGPQKPARHTIGFSAEFLESQPNNIQRRQTVGNPDRRVGFVCDDALFDGNRRNRFANDGKDPFEELHQIYVQKQIKLAQSQDLPFMIQNGQVILGQNDMIERYVQDANPRNRKNRDSDSENDDEFLDTTASMPSSRKNSLTSAGSKTGKSEAGCIVS